MLTPHSRSLLLEALRPPGGYSLDRAIGTTFTLDLLTLLTAPLAFTFFDWEQKDGQTTADPLALLEALRRHAEKIHIFCHAGMISVPPPDKRLLAYLEGPVIEVLPPNPDGIFHPKVWVLRFVSEGEPVRYRLLCLTRNLTFDRCWDTVLSVDGELTNSRRVFRGNEPLAEFVEALPGMAIRETNKSVRDAIEKTAQDIRRTAFELPPGFDEMVFVPIGISSDRVWPFPDNGTQILVLSPFLTAGFLDQLGGGHEIERIISRPESFAAIEPDSLRPIADRLYVLSPDADLDSLEGDDSPEEQSIELNGLHAKLFVAEDGKTATLWTGSANATGAAFARNVEFVVELSGHKKHCGTQALLGNEEDEAGLRNLLIPYPLHEAVEKPEEEVASGERVLERARRAIAEAHLIAVATSEEGGNLFSLQVLRQADVPLAIPEEVEAQLRPVTLQAEAAIGIAQGAHVLASFSPVSFEALTSFFAFHLQWEGSSGEVVSEDFALNLPLAGAPENRKERLLQSFLRDKDQVLRLLLLLLAEEGLSVTGFAEELTKSGSGSQFLAHLGHSTLFESLLKALDRNPASLVQAARIIDDLKQTPEGRALLPEGLDEVWEPVWKACQEISGGTDR